MKLGILIGEFMKEMSLEDAVKIAKRIGYSCVEIPAFDLEAKGKQYDGGSAKEVFDWARGMGLGVTSFQCHVGYSGPDWRRRVEHTKRIIDVAQQSAVDIVHTVSGPPASVDVHKQWLKGTKEIAETPEWGNSIQAYREICEHASSKGIKVAIEPVFVYMVSNYETTKKLFDDLGRDDLYINLDPSHFPYQREDVIPFIKDFGEKIIHSHVKDSTVEQEDTEEIDRGDAFSMGQGEQFKFAAPGKGVLDWPAILAALGEVGYDFVLSLEMGHGYEGESEDIARDNLKFFQNLLR